MNDILLYIIAFLVIPLGVYFLFSWLILYHLKSYGLKESLTNKAGKIYVLGIIVISILAIIMFFLVDWDSINLQELFTNKENNLFPTTYHENK